MEMWNNVNAFVNILEWRPFGIYTRIIFLNSQNICTSKDYNGTL